MLYRHWVEIFCSRDGSLGGSTQNFNELCVGFPLLWKRFVDLTHDMLALFLKSRLNWLWFRNIILLHGVFWTEIGLRNLLHLHLGLYLWLNVVVWGSTHWRTSCSHYRFQTGSDASCDVCKLPRLHQAVKNRFFRTGIPSSSHLFQRNCTRTSSVDERPPPFFIESRSNAIICVLLEFIAFSIMA